MCNVKKQALFTAKVLMAYAKDIMDFMVRWQDTDKMPSLDEFPVCVPAHWSAIPTLLPPLNFSEARPAAARHLRHHG